MSQTDELSADKQIKLLEEWVNQPLSVKKTNFDSALGARSAGTGTVCCCSQNTCGD